MVAINREHKEAIKEALLGLEQNVTVVIKSVYWQQTCIAVRHEWTAQNITARELRKIHECFMGEDCGDYS